MKYFPSQAKVTYRSKYGKDIEEFSCLEWMATPAYVYLTGLQDCKEDT